MMWEVKDPAGIKHVIEKDKKGFHGSENLAHCIEPIHMRPVTVSRLTLEIERNPEGGEWNGYAWIKL